MSDHCLPTRQPHGLIAGLLAAFGLAATDKPSLCAPDRMAALDDPATRKALADLSPHLLRDIGVTAQGRTKGPDGDGDGALRRRLW